MATIKLSGIVIARNSEDLIADCLDSLFFCDEVIVVDNDSSDRTREIAKKMGAKVFEHRSSDFSIQRNFALSKTSGDWVIYVDSDERVTPDLADEIRNAIGSTSFSAFKIQRKNFYLGSSRKNEWPYVEKLERLFRKEKLVEWYGELHESPRVKGEIGELKRYLVHYTHRNLSLMLKKTIEWSRIEAELRFNAGHPKITWWRFFRVMLTAFFDFYIKQGGWKVGAVGLIESLYQAFSIFITYARLWEMQQQKNKN